MRKSEFLRELEEALAGEVSGGVIRENLQYYDQYISQQAASGREEEAVIEELGGPRLIAKTIIDSSEAAGDQPDGGYGGSGNGSGRGGYGSGSGSSGQYGGGQRYEDRPQPDIPGFHYIDLNKWYWKLLLTLLLFGILLLVFSIVGGIFAILIRFAGPILLCILLYQLLRRR